ncbi:endothelin-converting enzyme 2-like [Rhipicephalus microplus]
MIVQQSVLSLIVQLLKAKSVGEKGLQYLVAWSVFRQLMKYTVPNLLVGRSTKSAACYEHAKKAMRIAVTSPYYQTVVPRKSLEDVKTMLLNIRNAYAETFENSSWVEGQDRFIALQKLFKMRSYVGSPERYLDPAYVEQLYNSGP